MTHNQIWIMSDRGPAKAEVRQLHPEQGLRSFLYRLTRWSRGVCRSLLTVGLRTDTGSVVYVSALAIREALRLSYFAVDPKGNCVKRIACQSGRYVFSFDRHGNLHILVKAQGMEGPRRTLLRAEHLAEFREVLERELHLRSGMGPEQTNGRANGACR